MKVALLSDIHANSGALKAVLADARSMDVEMCLVAGDFVGYYYDASTVLAMLRELPMLAVSGNHEAMLKALRDGADASPIVSRYGSGLLVALEELDEDCVEWLVALPPQRREVVSGRNVAICHGSFRDQDEYVYPDASQSQKDELFRAGADCDLLVFGHTHYPVVWNRGDLIVVNPGSVGQPRDRVAGSSWALWDTELHHVSLMRTRFDAATLMRECKRRDPQVRYLAEILAIHG